jgi:electron transport complex protein RnfC
MNSPSVGWLKRMSLRWGVHPQARKRPAADLPIAALPLPARLHLPLQQHVGAAAKPVVTVGQRVGKGELIAQAQGNISAPLHAPTSGTVATIADFPAPHPSGLAGLAVTLEVDGEDRWIEIDPPADPFALAPQEIAARVAAAGVVGMGGATFPSAVKLALGRRVAVGTLIINGGECEPYLSCDDRLMRERAAEVVDGMRIIRHAIGAREILCGIEDNKPEALAAMRAAAAAFGEVKIVALPNRYPMGSDKQLIQVLTGREVPADGRAADVGVLVHNVGTARAVHRAVRRGQPLISRIVTVNGGAVAAPRNLEVPIGALLSELVEACGGCMQEPARLVMGGPMMGHPLPSLDVPVIKGTSGVLALTYAEVEQRREAPCIRCARCVGACPMNLLPLEMSALIRAGELEAAVDWGLKDCIACGSCSYVCPAHIPLVHYFDHAKGELAARERAKLKQDATRQLAEQRIQRMAREAQEKAEAAVRRKAERERAKAARAVAEASA